MEYKIILDDELIKFWKRVETALDKGWKCQGGISVSFDTSNNIRYAQAMVRETTVFPEFDRDIHGIKNYPVGDKVRIVANNTAHRFEIGQTVTIAEEYSVLV